jgi:PAS domain S-box-containing protein
MTAAAAPRQLNVLLIEDNPGDARLIRLMLDEAAGEPCHVEIAARLSEGLRRLGEWRFDVVLLDLSLPDAQGLDTFLRAQAQAPAVPIVVLSGLDDEALAVRAVQAGAQDYLVKGHVDGDLLVRAMRYAVERKRAEEERKQFLARERAARAEAERLAAERAAILGQIADGVVIADPDGLTTFANLAARRLLGLSERPGDGDYQLMAIDRQACPPDQHPLARAALRGETAVDEEWIVRRADRTEIVVQGSASPVRAEDGIRLGAVWTLRDVTARHALERQKDEFLANVSHDLRTPLTGIKASIGVVLANEPPSTPEPLHRMFVNIEQAADRMSELVEDLLELARLQAGRAQLHSATHDLLELARRAARAIEPLAETRGQHVQLSLPTEPFVARVDASRLERALLNLLTNAHKYGREGGMIHLSLELTPNGVHFAVADDGPGIAPGNLERIFDRFYRPEGDATRRVQGSGLGLSITRAMAELHGGRVWAESVPGEGATFHLTLPVHREVGETGGRGEGGTERRGDRVRDLVDESPARQRQPGPGRQPATDHSEASALPEVSERFDMDVESKGYQGSPQAEAQPPTSSSLAPPERQAGNPATRGQRSSPRRRVAASRRRTRAGGST